MFSFINGILVEKSLESPGGAYFVVDVHGVGFDVRSSARSVGNAPEVGASIRLFTTLLVREDSISLVGFFTREERDLFTMLQSASGVGAKMALSLLSALSVPEIVQAIVSGQHAILTQAKGVGAKMAQKMVLELKEKMTRWRTVSAEIVSSSESPADTDAFREAESVLLSLGYQPHEITRAFQTLPVTTTTSSETVLHDALRWLAQAGV